MRNPHHKQNETTRYKQDTKSLADSFSNLSKHIHGYADWIQARAMDTMQTIDQETYMLFLIRQ